MRCPLASTCMRWTPARSSSPTTSATWALVCEFLADPSSAMVILDEFNIALNHGYVAVGEVLPRLQKRPPMQHVIVTGRGAPAELIEVADLVTEMKQVKHPFRKGIKAQAGVEF